jgi:hypothetical protein
MKWTLEDYINKAAGSLPEGWIIELCVEKGAGWVDLYYQGEKHDFDTTDMSLSRQVSEALEIALYYINDI